MKFVRILSRIIIVLVLVIGALWLWKREEVNRLMAVNSLFHEDRIVSNFSNMDTMFLRADIPRGDGAVSDLPAGPALTLPAGTDQWITDRVVTALVVLKDGTLVHESYYKDTNPEDLRISWSVAKSFISVLMGILVEEGVIGSIDDPVTQYAPALTESGYNGATIRNVLQMSSGVEFNEDYFDFWSDINRMGRVLALGQSMDGFAAGITATRAAPGEAWQYVSIDTHVLSMVIRGATGRSIADLMSEKLIQPLGLETDPYYLTDGYGVAFVLGGLNLRTRDYARFGQLILQDGEWDGTQVVPADWIADSTIASAPTRPGATGYGYQWWMPPDAREGEFFARGVYGQYIYIDKQSQTVIAVNGADRAFRTPGAHSGNIEIFRQIARGE